MNIDDLTFVKNSLRGIRPIYWAEISSKSGVPLGTLRKVAYEEVSDPRFWTIKKLADYFRALSPETTDSRFVIPGTPIDGATVRETTGKTRRIGDRKSQAK